MIRALVKQAEHGEFHIHPETGEENGTLLT